MPVPVVYHEGYAVDIGRHVFPTAKYRLVLERLLRTGVIAAGQIRRPEPVTDEQVLLVHTPDYVRKLRSGTFTWEEEATREVPFSPGLREGSWLAAGGSLLAGTLALDFGAAVHLGGGFHHAFPDHGEGFCVIHDVAIAVRAMFRTGRIRRAAIVDLDVHHGNGSAVIFADDPEVFTFSMHQQNNYPAWKPRSDLDVGLADGTCDADYLALLERHLPEILERHGPELVYYLAGADPYEQDQLGGLGLTLDGLRRRDEFVFERCLGAGARVAALLAGGYATRTEDTVEIHCGTVRAAEKVLSSFPSIP